MKKYQTQKATRNEKVWKPLTPHLLGHILLVGKVTMT